MLARSPNRKAAVAYLAASGAAAITVMLRDGASTITTASKITGTVAARWWVDAKVAGRISSAARQFAGPDPDLSTATAAVAASVARVGARLTDDATAISRAAAAVINLDSMVDAMKRDGTLHGFNREYKIRRAAAIAAGHGFMNYSAALRRLRLLLIPMVAAG